MAQTKLEIQLRCNACDSVLVVAATHADKDGCFSYVEPCEKCGVIVTKATPYINNQVAYRLGLIGLNLIKYPSEKIGDEIDRGLVLRKLLVESGFGIAVLENKNATG